MAHYLDTSVVVSLLLYDSHSLKANSWLTEATRTLLVSDFCATEFVAVISRQTRRDILTPDDAYRTLRIFDDWRSNDVQAVKSHAEQIAKAEQYVRDFATKLAAPDAIHLAFASHLNATLVTFDDRLAAAAERHAVPFIIPG